MQSLYEYAIRSVYRSLVILLNATGIFILCIHNHMYNNTEVSVLIVYLTLFFTICWNKTQIVFDCLLVLFPYTIHHLWSMWYHIGLNVCVLHIYLYAVGPLIPTILKEVTISWRISQYRDRKQISRKNRLVLKRRMCMNCAIKTKNTAFIKTPSYSNGRSKSSLFLASNVMNFSQISLIFSLYTQIKFDVYYDYRSQNAWSLLTRLLVLPPLLSEKCRGSVLRVSLFNIFETAGIVGIFLLPPSLTVS